MRKNSKTESTDGIATSAPAAAAPAETAVPAVKKPAKAVKKPGRKTAAKKTAAKSPAKKTTANKNLPTIAPNEPSDEDIRLRAYFLAERRMQHAIDGDPSNDWLEARRQLRDEAGLK